MAIFTTASQKPIVAGQPVVAEVSLSERLAFIRKVYSLLALSIVFGVTAGVVTLSSAAFLQTVVNNYWLFLIATFGVLIAAQFFAKGDKSLAFILLASFTILTGITFAPMVFAYQDVVLQAALTTIAVFLGLTIYTFVSKKDFSFLGGMLTVSLIAMIVLGLINIFWLRSGFVQVIESAVGILIFSGFILYDTSNIMRVYPVTMPVQATLSLYLNILNLFLRFLYLFSGRR